MRIRDSLFVIIGLALFTFAVYFKLERDKLEDKNLNLKISKRTLSQEFKNYKSQELQKKLLQAKQRAQAEKKRVALEQEQVRIQKIENLKIKVDSAFEAVQNLYKKYKNGKCKKLIILEALNQHAVFIKNYQGSSVGNVKSKYLQTKTRAIGLEEIQKVRRHQQGFIKINATDANISQTIYVKDLGMYDLYIGSSTTF